ncbi:LRP chaperone MESD isoform X2 [Columba livia]|uniref:LRP chaperone MESD n=1 Tax=Columba livia TaxID=8932 RepID=A0A2I0MD21_COLLI|nr:LDLR chaperone MESD [Columba livia]PKK27579.1 mesoderm development candidate 2 [Columba livia]
MERSLVWAVPLWLLHQPSSQLLAPETKPGCNPWQLTGPPKLFKDDDIEEGDLPEHKRPPAPIDFSKIDPGKPESILKLTKKGKTLMMFVTVSGNPTEKETEEITSLWQGSLFNANYDVQRFIVGSNRAIFMLRDGGYAWEIKDFLISQERCADVTLEGQVYPGKGAEESEKVKNKTKPEKAKKKKDADKKSDSIKEDNRATKQREDL